MSEQVEFESAAEVLSAANLVAKTTPSQLQRLYRSGLIPRPRQKGIGRGSVALYPAGTSRQLTEVLKLKKCEPRLAHIAWRLWWNGGYAIDMKPIKTLFTKINTQWDAIRRELIDKKRGGLSDGALDYEDRGDVKDIRFKPLARARKRVGTNNFPAVLHILLEVITGTFTRFDIDPKAKTSDRTQFLLERALDIVEARIGHSQGRLDRKQPFGAWLEANSEETLTSLAHLVRDGIGELDSNRVCDLDLNSARVEFRDFLIWVKRGSQVIENLFGAKAFGLTSLAFMIDEIEANIHFQAIGIRFWIALRNHPTLYPARRFFEQLKKDISRLELLRSCIDDLKEELPHIAKEISKWKMIAALEAPERGKRFQVSLERIYLNNKNELDQFWQRHPEYIVGTDGDFILT
jgi:hypothetical protein